MEGEAEATERRKRRRRRRRKRAGGEAPTPVAQAHAGAEPLDEEDDLTEVEFAERAEEVWEPAGEPVVSPPPQAGSLQEAEPTRGKRRRRRRGRRRERGERAEAATAAESAEVEHLTELEEEHAAEAAPRDLPHARAGERPSAAEHGPRVASEPEPEDLGEEEDQEGESRPVYRGIPTWEETVGYIIQQNMEARARSPHAGGPRGRGNKGRGHGT